MMHSLYFFAFAVATTFVAIVIFWAQYSRYKKDGTPFNFTALKIVVGIALVMWTGAAETIYFYGISPITAAWAAFSLGITLCVFVVWGGSGLLKKIQNDGALIKELSTRDALTGLWNLRVFHEFLTAEIDRSNRIEQPLSIIILHLDNLAKINQEYGYKSGDIILQACGERLSTSLRKNDRLSRYKNATFALILPHTGKDGVQVAVKRLTELLKPPFAVASKEEVNITYSAGIASYTECAFPRETGEDTSFFSRAISAMNVAQEKGGNCIYAFEKGESLKV